MAYRTSDALKYLLHDDIDERNPLGIRSATGTAGRPKGVTYTHRSTVLHALTIATGAGMALGPGDCTCAMVPMFHANCFGQPHGSTCERWRFRHLATPTFGCNFRAAFRLS
jgi:acyl-CoA synthetase (AMP-forming)/AMP-acid ligase II